MTREQLCRIGCALPGVAVGIWFRTPALEVRGKSFTRLKEDGATVVFLVDDVDEQEILVTARPEIDFITDHSRGYAAVLARLARLPVSECRERLEQGWRIKAPKRLVRELDAAQGTVRPKRRRA